MNGKPLTSMVYQNILNDIINGDITANDILSENHLAERFQVSRAPVREALITLCDENYLQSIPRMGYKVLQILPQEAKELVDMRLALETFLLNKSFDSLTSHQLDALVKVHQDNLQEEKVFTQVQDNWHRNTRFHLMLASFSGNSYMQNELEKTLIACARASTQYFLGRKTQDEYEDYHGPLLDALKDRNKQRALSLLEQDIKQLL